MQLSWEQDGEEWFATYRGHALRMFRLSTGWVGYVDGGFAGGAEDEAALEARLIDYVERLDRRMKDLITA